MDSAEQTRKELDDTLAHMKTLGVARKDGKEITREDAAKVMGLMASTFAEIKHVMQEAFAVQQGIFASFAAKLVALELTMNDPPESVLNKPPPNFQVKDGE